MGKQLPTRDFRALISLVVVTAVLTATLTVLTGSVRAEDDTEEPAPQLILSVSEAQPGDTITVEASGFRVEEDGSFIYSSTITVGGVPIAGVASVDPESGYLHAGRYSDLGQWIAEHIHIDPPGLTPDGAFTATFVLPDDLPAGEHELVAISCWGGARRRLSRGRGRALRHRRAGRRGPGPGRDGNAHHRRKERRAPGRSGCRQRGTRRGAERGDVRGSGRPRGRPRRHRRGRCWLPTEAQGRVTRVRRWGESGALLNPRS